MGNTIYQNCAKMLEDVEGTISLEELESLIIRCIGGQRGTVTNALHVMGSTGLLKDIGNSRFEVLKDNDPTGKLQEEFSN